MYLIKTTADFIKSLQQNFDKQKKVKHVRVLCFFSVCYLPSVKPIKVGVPPKYTDSMSKMMM